MFQSASPEKVSGFRSDRLHDREDGWHGTAEVALFGGKTTNEYELARYFFPFCKTDLVAGFYNTIDGDIALPTSSNPINLLSIHFNVLTQNSTLFKSKISIRPEQSVVGAGFQWRKSIGMNDDQTRGFFTSVSFPIQRVSNNLNFKEKILNDGGGVITAATLNPPYFKPVANMTEAFQQDAWDFGKIKIGSQSKTGVADIEFKVGYEWIQEEPFHLESYLGMVIPTGNKPNSQFIFEPIVGNGRHWGITFGNSLGIQIWEDQAHDRQLRMEYAGHTQYLFRNTQCRSLDLVCKPWSRYMKMYRNQDDAITASTISDGIGTFTIPTPGINILTLPLKVRPGFSHNMTTAGVFLSKNWRVEGGYNLYCRQSECVQLACPWQQGPAIIGRAGEAQGSTNPVRDITGNARLDLIDPNTTAGEFPRMALGDYKYNMITEDDLDLVSASSPSIITHTVYAAGGYTFDCDYPTFFTVGGSYEFNQNNNAAPERWALWGKLGLSF
ncbi:hypothetical protein ACFLXW_00205 [Candidatus Dependentiae bacterium]